MKIPRTFLKLTAQALAVVYALGAAVPRPTLYSHSHRYGEGFHSHTEAEVFASEQTAAPASVTSYRKSDARAVYKSRAGDHAAILGFLQTSAAQTSAPEKSTRSLPAREQWRPATDRHTHELLLQSAPDVSLPVFQARFDQIFAAPHTERPTHLHAPLLAITVRGPPSLPA